MGKSKKKHIPEKLRAIVRDQIRESLSVLDLQAYEGDIVYPDEAKSGSREDAGLLAESRVDTRYLRAHFYFYPQFVQEFISGKMSEREVREVVSHEVSHIATERMKELCYSAFKNKDEVRDAWEELTTRVGRLVAYKIEQRRKKC